jgi:hypothetical protein
MSSFIIKDTLKVQAYIITCYERMHTFSIEFWALWTELLRHLPALLHHTGICDHEDVSSEGHKDGSHLVPRPHKAWEMAALLQHFGWECLIQQPYNPVLAPSNFQFYSPLKMHLSAHRVKNGLKCDLQWFHSQCPELYAESIHSLITQCDKCLNLQGWLCGRAGQCSVFSLEMFFWT